jgi:hypothetical protein
MNNTTIDNNNAAQRPWWTVRGSLLATLAALSLVLAAIVFPTPLSKWVFGERPIELATR